MSVRVLSRVKVNTGVMNNAACVRLADFVCLKKASVDSFIQCFRL